MSLSAPLLLDAANPVNRLHPWAPDCWWVCARGLTGGAMWYDLMSLPGGLDRGHHATLVNMAAKPSATSGWQEGGTCPGVPGMLAFDGSNDYANAGDHAFYASGLTAMTWLVDVYPRSVTGFQGILGKGSLDSSTVGSYQLYLSGTTFGFIVLTGGSRQVQLTTASAVINTWHQVGANWQASGTAAIFVNGVKKNSQGTSATVDTVALPLVLGTNHSGSSTLPGYIVNALFASIRFYRRVFSDQEMMQLYQHSRNGSPGLLRPLVPPRVGAAAVLNRRTRGARIGSRMVP